MQQLDADYNFEFHRVPILVGQTRKFSKKITNHHLLAIPSRFASLLHRVPENKEEVVLPVVVVEGGRRKHFIWNGSRIVRRDISESNGKKTTQDGLQAILQDVQHHIHRAFFPKRNEVTDDYWAFISWRAGHRLSSAMVGNFATQSLLAAVGVGAKHQLPAAASINWLLKDGLGRLGRLCVAACLGHKFDSQLKRYRWVTSLTFTGATALEFMAPLMPQHFLFLASVANIGKAVGVTTYVATHPSFMRSFARGDNLADINAKGQAQQMVMDTLGLALCVALTYGVRRSPKARIALPLAMFPCLAVADLFCIFKELKATHLRSLNQERTEILVQEWLQSGAVLTPKEVSAKERLLLPRQTSKSKRLPLTFLSLDRLADDPDQLLELLKQYRELNYLLTVSAQQSRLHIYPQQHQCIGLTLRDGAASADVISAILQAEILRGLVRRKRVAPHSESKVESVMKSLGLDSPSVELRFGSAEVLQLSLHLAKNLSASLCTDLRASAWETDSFLIPPNQKDGFISQAI